MCPGSTLKPLADTSLPDEEDRHVLAAALAAEATVLCTSNIKHFPAEVVAPLGFEVLTPDELLSRLVTEYEPQMLAAHRTAVASLNGATDESTVQRCAGHAPPRRPRSWPDCSGPDETSSPRISRTYNSSAFQ